jgi:hypothetical protein
VIAALMALFVLKPMRARHFANARARETAPGEALSTRV